MSRSRRRGGPLTVRLARHVADSVLEAAQKRSTRLYSPGSVSAQTRGGASRARASQGDHGDHLASHEDRSLERAVMAEERGGLGDFILAYRRELAPLLAAGGATLIAAEGHQLAPRRWFLALLVGGILTLGWHFRASRPVERLYGAMLGLLGSGLVAAGWAFDVTHTWFWAALVGGALAAGVPWWLHQLPRGKLLGGKRSPKTMQQQAKAVVAAWPDIAEARGLAGVRLQQVVPDEFGWTMKLRIPTTSKHTVKTIVDAADGLATSFRTRQGAVRVEPVRDRADLAMVRVNITDPLQKPIPYPGLSGTSIAVPLRIGIFEDRSELAIRMPGGHWLMGGATGSGKSYSQRVLLAELLQREDVVVWGCDIAKAGLQFLPFIAALSRLATEPQEAVSMLKAAMAIQRARAKWMGAEALGEWPLDSQHPQLVIVIDEVSDLLTNPEIQDLLEALTKLGREQAITVIAATQRASADAMGDSAVARAQFGGRLALKCRERGDGDLILGRGMSAEGWRPDRLQLAGQLLVLDDDHQAPRPGRTYLLETSDARKLADRAAASRPALDDVSAAAMAESDTQPAQSSGPTARRGPKVPARERILRLLTDAGADGMSGPDIVAALADEVSQPGVYKALKALDVEGLASRDELRVWHLVRS